MKILEILKIHESSRAWRTLSPQPPGVEDSGWLSLMTTKINLQCGTSPNLGMLGFH